MGNVKVMALFCHFLIYSYVTLSANSSASIDTEWRCDRCPHPPWSPIAAQAILRGQRLCKRPPGPSAGLVTYTTPFWSGRMDQTIRKDWAVQTAEANWKRVGRPTQLACSTWEVTCPERLYVVQMKHLWCYGIRGYSWKSAYNTGRW
jgi:hypothetical protein